MLKMIVMLFNKRERKLNKIRKFQHMTWIQNQQRYLKLEILETIQ